ncbi:MAG: NAD(P)-dependent oxidoreductase [Patescibacteria group bacterium]|jgi:uronate dehydrogenase
MSKNIVITGATGVVGSVLVDGLANFHDVTPLTRLQCDMTNLELLSQCVPKDTDCLVHLAWKDSDIYSEGQFDPDNIVMALNVLEVAVRYNIKHVVLASSVHVREYRGHEGVISASDHTMPTSLYGATKVYLEELGKYYARYHNLQVTAVRLGGVNRDDSPVGKDEQDYNRIYLSHIDLITAFNDIVNEPNVPASFSMFYLVSEGDSTIHHRDKFEIKD